jgi:hypothetical protein
MVFGEGKMAEVFGGVRIISFIAGQMVVLPTLLTREVSREI